MSISIKSGRYLQKTLTGFRKIKKVGSSDVVKIYSSRGKKKVSTSLTTKGQNIGSSTKNIYKEIFDSDILNIKKQKYMSLGSFKSHTYCSIAKNGSVVVYQN